MIGLEFPDYLFDEEAKQNTPDRVRRMMSEFEAWRNWNGLELGKGIFPAESDDLVVIRNIEFTSFCNHHILPFSGICNVAYLPSTHIVGLSKIPRTVRKFASRPQLQERMTSQIADYLNTWIPGVKGIMVTISANHSCMQIRGARMTGVTETSATRGIFRDDDQLKQEVLQLLRNGST